MQITLSFCHNPLYSNLEISNSILLQSFDGRQVTMTVMERNATSKLVKLKKNLMNSEIKIKRYRDKVLFL